MKAIVVRQPWATLIALGVKQIETRPFPPNGPMRPDGVRGLPGLAIERGERIAIVAGAGMAGWGRPSTWRHRNEREFGPFSVENDGGGLLLRGDSLAWPYRLPLGAVVCTVTVDDALPIVGHGDAAEPPYLRNLPTLGLTLATLAFDVAGHRKREDFTDQLPLGDFTPGRWGWLLSDPRPCDPIPCKGRQGVFELPAEIAEVLS